MNPLVLSAYINAGSNLASTGLSWILNRKDWNDNNSYNSPSELKNRLLGAGISAPAADAAITGGNLQSSASTAASTNGVGNILGDYIALQQLELQKKETQANVENINSQTRKNDAETARFNALTPLEQQKMSQDIEESKSRMNLNGANARLAEVSANRVELMTSVELQKFEEDIKEIRSRILLNQQLTKNEQEKYWHIEAQTQSINLDNWLKEHTNQLAVDLNVDPRSPWYMQLVQNLKGGDVSAIDAILDGIANTLGKLHDRTFGRMNEYLFGKDN